MIALRVWQESLVQERPTSKRARVIGTRPFLSDAMVSGEWGRRAITWGAPRDMDDAGRWDRSALSHCGWGKGKRQLRGG